MAEADYFLKLDGIEGESRDDKHKGEIEIQSFSWGLSHEALRTGGGGAGGTGKVSVQDFHFVAQTGIQSPPLMVATATGQHFKKATLTVRSSAHKQEFLKIQLEEILVSSYQVGGTDAGDDGLPRDQFSLNFTKVQMSVTEQAADGSAGRVFGGGYDLKANVKM